MTIATEKGFKIGEKYEVVKNEGSRYYAIADVVKFIRDDLSNSPIFQKACGDEVYITLDNLKKIEEKKEKQMAHQYKVGDKVVVIKGREKGERKLWFSYQKGAVATVTTAQYNDKDYGDIVGCDVGTNRQSISVEDIAPAIDFTKPLFTLEGTPVVLISTLGRDAKFPIMVYEGTATNITRYDRNGFAKNGVARRNLTNTEYKKEPIVIERYVNLYEGGQTPGNHSNYATRSAADRAAEFALNIYKVKRIGVTKIVLTEGIFDD